MEKTQLQNYHVHYGPAQGWSRVDLRELWRYKDLIWLFVKRDFNVMYKEPCRPARAVALQGPDLALCQARFQRHVQADGAGPGVDLN